MELAAPSLLELAEIAEPSLLELPWMVGTLGPRRKEALELGVLLITVLVALEVLLCSIFDPSVALSCLFFHRLHQIAQFPII